MKKVGIGIDSYKLDVFKKYLDNGGYTYKVFSSLGEDTYFISVQTDSVAKLQEIVVKANNKARHKKKSH